MKSAWALIPKDLEGTLATVLLFLSGALFLLAKYFHRTRPTLPKKRRIAMEETIQFLSSRVIPRKVHQRCCFLYLSCVSKLLLHDLRVQMTEGTVRRVLAAKRCRPRLVKKFRGVLASNVNLLDGLMLDTHDFPVATWRLLTSMRKTSVISSVLNLL